MKSSLMKVLMSDSGGRGGDFYGLKSPPSKIS